MNISGTPCMEKIDEKESCSVEETPQKNDAFQTFLKEIETKGLVDEKISSLLSYMEVILAEKGSPRFKFFWEARKECLNHFKDQSLNFAVRGTLWNKYMELSKEALKLKELLDAESAFAAEQIDLAIVSLESELQKKGSFPPAKFETVPVALKRQIEEYRQKQGELELLNNFASRINSLRKELVKTDMRIRFKNKFFQRLSTAGDFIFPRRKELIKTLSEQFTRDVEQFIQENFSSEQYKKPLFVLRDEIKALQGMAKLLTLNTQAFNETRMRLSECWDKLKVLEKERKKEKAKETALYREAAEKILTLLGEYTTVATTLTVEERVTKLDAIAKEMQGVQLARDDVKMIRDKIQAERDAIAEIRSAAERERALREKEKEDEERARYRKLSSELDQLIEAVPRLDIQEIDTKREELKQSTAALTLTKLERQDLDKRFKMIKDRISQVRIQNLPKDDKEAYDQLVELLEERKTRRKEIRDQLEIYRRSSSTSGFDIEQAMKQRELLEQEKERLQQVETEIEEINAKMDEIQERE